MGSRILTTASSLVLLTAGACIATLAPADPQASSSGATTATSKSAASKTATKKTTPAANQVTHSAHKSVTSSRVSTAHKSTTHARTSSTSVAKNHGATTTAASTSKATSTTRKAAKRSKVQRPLTGKQRLARLHLEPDRVREIQQALARDGYLKSEPSGIWDEPTHAAMLRYQNDHGFSPTGLPDAKSLMKLGLGPHPLPAELDPTLARTASPNTTKTDSPAPATPPAIPATQQDETPSPQNP